MSDPRETQPEDTDPSIDVGWPETDVALVALGGEHDLQSAPSVEWAIDEAFESCSHLIIDLSSVQFIDSSIVNLLVRVRREADDRGCRFNLVLGTAPIVARTLEICGVLPALNRVATVEEAYAAAQA